MKETIYLARPWTALLQSSESGEYLPYPVRAFRTLEAAERFAIQDIPLSLNPCIACWINEEGMDEVDEDEIELSVDLTGEYETPEMSHTVLLKDFLFLLLSLGLTPPGNLYNEELTAWWQNSAEHMTAEQKQAIWRFLVPEPYQIIPVELDESEG